MEFGVNGQNLDNAVLAVVEVCAQRLGSVIVRLLLLVDGHAMAKLVIL